MLKEKLPNLEFIKDKTTELKDKIQGIKPINLNSVVEVENLKELIASIAQRFGDKTAFSFYRGKELIEVSHIQFENDIRALATAFLNRGFKNKHIAIIGENCYEWIVTFFAVTCGVGVAVPIDRDLSGEDLNALLDKYDVDVVICHNKQYNKIQNSEFHDTDIDEFIFLQDCEETCISKLIEEGRDSIILGDKSFDELDIDTDALSAIFSTSGTTGMCKGVMLSQNNMISTVLDGVRYIDVDETDKAISVLPYHHTYEFLCGIAAALHAGTSIFINNSMKLFLKNMKEQQPTGLVAVSLIIEKIYSTIWTQAKKSGQTKKLQTALFVGDSLKKVGIDVRRKIFSDILEVLGGKLRIIISGGSALSPEVIKGFESLGITVLQGYGITECSPLISVNNKVKGTYESVGAPITCCDVKIQDGEILVKGKNVMLGYYKDENATKEVFDDGWFKTGDLGYLDQKGCIYITGRKKNLIILKNGENVSPEELEMKIQECEAVEEVIVTAKAQSLNTEPVITAVVFVKQNYVGPLTAENTVRAHIDEINKKVPSYKRIRALEFKEEAFEKTTSQKIKRNI